MPEPAESRLARVEAKIDVLVKGVDKLQEDIETFGMRVNKLELDTQESMWQLRERVAELEREAANLRLDVERLKHDQESQRQTQSERIWELVMRIATPIASGAIGGMLAARWPGMGG